MGPPVRPMLATAGELPVGPGWAYEFKWDGVRAVAEITAAAGPAAGTAGGALRLSARSGADITAGYPELAGLADLAGRVPDVVLDGEIVVLSGGGTSFQELAERMHVRDPVRARALAAARPVTYLIFDVLRLYGVDLYDRPYQERRATLERLDLAGRHWHLPPVFNDGPATLAASAEHGLEGVMAKRLASTYRPGRRTTDWVKVKHVRSADVVVGGYRPMVRPVGSLLVGEPDPGGGLAYRGRVGGGFTDRDVTDLLELLTPLRQEASPFADPVPRVDARGAIWVAPELVVEVEFANRTADGRFRFPRLRRIRTDKQPSEVDGEAAGGSGAGDA